MYPRRSMRDVESGCWALYSSNFEGDEPWIFGKGTHSFATKLYTTHQASLEAEEPPSIGGFTVYAPARRGKRFKAFSPSFS